MASRPISSILATIGKLTFAAAVFCTTVGGYTYFASADRQPLPNGGVDADGCTIWFMGSSSINKWRGLRADMAPWSAHNRGVDGAQIGNLARRFAIEPDGAAPAATVLYAGENDIAKGASAAQTATRMTELVDAITKKFPHHPVFVVAMKPSPTRWRFRPEQLRYDALISRALASREGVRFLNIGSRLLVDGKPGPFYVEDGVHLNPQGYVRWGGGIRQGLDAAMPRDIVDRCTRRR